MKAGPLIGKSERTLAFFIERGFFAFVVSCARAMGAKRSVAAVRKTTILFINIFCIEFTPTQSSPTVLDEDCTDARRCQSRLTIDIQLDIILTLMRLYFYETGTGTSPIKRFIDALPKEDQARFLEVIDEIEINGFNATRVIFKPIEGKLWEIKFRSVRTGYRVFYILLEKGLMVWLHAFSKKTQKTPQRGLDIARKRMKEVFL